ADHQGRCARGPAAGDGAAAPKPGTDRAGAVVASDRLVIAERAAADGEHARLTEDGTASACGVAVPALVASGLGHVAGELAVADAGGRKMGDSSAEGIAGLRAAAAIGAQGQVAEECAVGDDQVRRTEIGDAAASSAAGPAQRAFAGIADGLVVAQDIVG